MTHGRGAALALAASAAIAVAGAVATPAARASGATAATPGRGGAASATAGSTPAVTSGGGLNGIDAVSASDVWAVGFAYAGSTYVPMAQRWNGKAWKVVATPGVSGAADAYLYGVDADSASDAWAVGYSSAGSTSSTLVDHWNGKTWQVVPSPNPSGAAGAYLYAVHAISATNVWAVGYQQPSFSTLAEHWNGKAWKIVPSPDPAGASGSWLNGVDATSASNVWAVGYWSQGLTTSTLAERWNGHAWSIVASPSPGGSGAVTALQAVRSPSPGNAWAVGYLYNGSLTAPVTEHWGGHAWKAVSSPAPSGSTATSLVAVDADAATDAWAVGDSTSAGGVTGTVAEHWNGTAWRLAASPNPAGSSDTSLTGVAAVSASDAWAVGYSWNGSVTSTVTEHWKGKKWVLVTAPS
jgi:hypothetical protein